MLDKIVNKTHGDRIIWGIVVLLCLISLLVVYSSTGALAYKKHNGHVEFYLFKQLGVFLFGFIIMWFIHKWNYTIYRRWAVALFVISIPLLIYTLFFGATINDGSRWLRIPIIGLTFQTSDLAKLGLFMFLARQLSMYQNQIDDLKTVALQIFAPVAIIVLLIAPANLSTALMLSITCGLLFFIGRIKLSHLALLGFVAVFGFLTIYGVSKLTGKGRAATWEKRMQEFSAKEDYSTMSYQKLQAKIAIAKGGWHGVGPGNSSQRNFLPHGYSDMVYPIIIEEYGLIGAAFVLFLYMLLLWRSIVLFRKCPYAFGAFLAIGLSFTLVFQSLVNMGVGVSLFPVTGLTLPLISMGGSSVWFTSATLGIILSVSKYVEEMEGNKQLKGSTNNITTTTNLQPA
jgi:cell division protein FtsW